MFGTDDLPRFVLSGVMLSITPSADSLDLITRSVTQGVRAGAASAFTVFVMSELLWCVGRSMNVRPATGEQVNGR